AKMLAEADKKRLENAGKGAPKDKKEGDTAETEDVFNQMHELMEPFETAHEVFGAGTKLKQAFDATKAASEGKFAALDALAKDWAKEKPSGVEKGFAALDLVLGGHSFSTDTDFT